MSYELDSKVQYLAVRHGAGSDTWSYFRKFRGRMIRISLGRCDQVPRREAARRCEEISGNLVRYGNPDGKPGPQTVRNPTVADAWRCYCSRKDPSFRQRRQWERYLAPRFWNVEIAAIRHADIRALHVQISQRYPVAANRVIALMSAIINAAIREDVYSGTNPAGMIAKNRETPRRRYLDQAEKERVLAVLARKMQSGKSRTGAEVLYMALLTGARPGNVCAMRWDEVDLDAAVWVIPPEKAKARREIDVSLSRTPLDLLRSIAESQRGRSDYVFPHRFDRKRHITTVKSLWAAILREASVSDCHIHDLRHTYGTYQLAAGADITTVSETLGHADISTTKRIYAHVIDRRKREAAEAAERAILGTE